MEPWAIFLIVYCAGAYVASLGINAVSTGEPFYTVCERILQGCWFFVLTMGWGIILPFWIFIETAGWISLRLSECLGRNESARQDREERVASRQEQAQLKEQIRTLEEKLRTQQGNLDRLLASSRAAEQTTQPAVTKPVQDAPDQAANLV
jgi:hypothetical protein